MGILDRLRGRPAGEVSALREAGTRWTTYGSDYRLGSLNTDRLQYDICRQLYRNTLDNYKLGAWAAKPVVNTAAGFMGAPRFLHKSRDGNTQGVLDEGMNQWDASFLKINRNGSRDGDVWARLELKPNRFDENDVDLAIKLVPPEWVTPIFDPLTGALQEVIIAWPAQNQQREGHNVRNSGDYKIYEVLTPTERRLEVDGQAPEEVRRLIAERSTAEDYDNRWGFIPLVHFRNDAEDTHRYGMSDLEPIEPFMRAYHDVFLYSIQGSKTIARPKTQFRLNNVGQFLERNFTAEEIKDKRLRFGDKEIFLMEQDDSVEFIVADTGLMGTTTLLEFLYYCIVDVSQTPEFAFGTAVASSKASVSEQMPVLARNIRRKRGEYAEPYSELAEMYLAMQAQVGMPKPDTYRVDVEWEELTQRDDSEVAGTLESLMASMATGVEAGLIGLESAIDFIREFVPSMLPASTEGSDADELQRIAAGKLLLDRMNAGDFDDNAPPAPPRLEPVPNEA
jgi:hypothetical protein